MGDSDTNRIGGFEKISVKGFRRLWRRQTELRPNSSYRSEWNWQDLPAGRVSLLASSAQGALNRAVSEFPDYQHDTYDRAEISCLAYRWVFTITTPQLLLRLKPQGASYVIDEEILSQQRYTSPRRSSHIESRGSDVRYFEVEQARLSVPHAENNPETCSPQVPQMYREHRRTSAESSLHQPFITS